MEQLSQCFNLIYIIMKHIHLFGLQSTKFAPKPMNEKKNAPVFLQEKYLMTCANWHEIPSRLNVRGVLFPFRK